MNSIITSRHDDKMKKHIMICKAMLVLSVGCLLPSSCRKESPAETTRQEAGAAVEVIVSAESSCTRAFQNGGSHNVNRIAVIPFRKISESMTDDNSSYVPDYSLAVQKDITAFPVNGIVLHLPVSTTYKVLVIGYNTADYNFSDMNSPSNRFTIGSLTSPATLESLYLYPKSAVSVPQFFTCICTAYSGTRPAGTAFRPGQGLTLSGTLKRIVSGLSVTITDVPAFVKSVSLVAENLTKASKATDGSIVLSQTASDEESRIIRKMVPGQDKRIVFNEYLLPTFKTNMTRFFLDVEYGPYTHRYVVKVPDSDISSANKLALLPNQAINISGSYGKINIGFTLGFAINLDDDAWDGIQ